MRASATAFRIFPFPAPARFRLGRAISFSYLKPDGAMLTLFDGFRMCACGVRRLRKAGPACDRDGGRCPGGGAGPATRLRHEGGDGNEQTHGPARPCVDFSGALFRPRSGGLGPHLRGGAIRRPDQRRHSPPARQREAAETNPPAVQARGGHVRRGPGHAPGLQRDRCVHSPRNALRRANVGLVSLRSGCRAPPTPLSGAVRTCRRPAARHRVSTFRGERFRAVPRYRHRSRPRS